MATPSRRFARRLDLARAMQKKSHFLFGPRQVGKSSLVAEALPQARMYNLLETDALLRLSQRPARLREELQSPDEIVVIDEIQLLPELLNEVHWLIEKRRIRFLLTGSSARKLRRGGVNLLGGRARTLHLHPLTSAELGDAFSLSRALSFGTLPAIYLSDEPEQDLGDYLAHYLREEVAAEAQVRNLPAFSRFLEVAALCNTTQLNFTAIANDAQVPRTTIHEYFEILKDTLIAHQLDPFQATKKRKPVVTPKLHFFDVGVVRTLLNRGPLRRQDADYGSTLEGYIFHELKAFVDGGEAQSLHYWRTTSQFEVDFILDGRVAIEVKASRNIGPQDLRGLLAFAEEIKGARLICVCHEPTSRVSQDVHIWPVEHFLEALWAGSLG